MLPEFLHIAIIAVLIIVPVLIFGKAMHDKRKGLRLVKRLSSPAALRFSGFCQQKT